MILQLLWQETIAASIFLRSSYEDLVLRWEDIYQQCLDLVHISIASSVPTKKKKIWKWLQRKKNLRTIHRKKWGLHIDFAAYSRKELQQIASPSLPLVKMNEPLFVDSVHISFGTKFCTAVWLSNSSDPEKSEKHHPLNYDAGSILHGVATLRGPLAVIIQGRHNTVQ